MFTASDLTSFRASRAFMALTEEAKSVGASLAMRALARDARDVGEVAAARELAHEALHVGNWKEVRTTWRAVYAAATLVWVYRGGAASAKGATRALDEGALLGGETFANEIRHAIARVREEWKENERTNGEKESVRGKRARIGGTWGDVGASTEGDTTERRREVSLEAFYRDYMAKSGNEETGGEIGTPVVLEGVASHWPAVKKWRERDYILDVVGDRTVPIEVGETYVHDAWTQKLMTVREFVEEYVERAREDGAPGDVGYLAQHEIFEQCPELKRDIEEPMYCVLGTGGVNAVNAWFGPAHTVSPAHTDPHHNLLCQVVGAKRVRLFAPSETPRMYPHVESKMSNTSRVDVMRPDLNEFPEFASAAFFDATLLPGDALYIPPGWWHHVRALDVSFSVSYWWN